MIVVFLPADPLTLAEVKRVHADAIERIRRVLRRLIDPDLERAFQLSGWGSQHVPPPLVVNAAGFSLRALIRNGQRAQLEKLCRYVKRPAISLAAC
ncbi:hypothetical protein [Saltatorellus ferox]